LEIETMDEKRDTEAKIDFDRVERGVQLHAEMIEPGRYKVSGGDITHWVDLIAPDHPRCDCGDYLWRDAVCKHIIAARMREGDEQVLFQVGALVKSLRQRRSKTSRSAA
jgi:hypothetical protein